jgi:LuxR family maltose regulon positive regulatory protein
LPVKGVRYNEVMSTPLLATKLYRPPPRSNSVLRQRLIEQLNGGLQRNLTLIAAPAGFGKTTLLSQWLAACALPTVWLTLDDSDSEPARFLAYLLAAIQTVVPQFGAGMLAALLAPQPPPTVATVTALINELAALAQPLVLVLDDYHLVDSRLVDEALSLLLTHQPPQLHLVIATREDPQLPLARLRARDQLIELRAVDLRFTSEEAAELLNQSVGASLAAEVVAALERRTEGWAAGLYLAALSLRGQQDAAGFLRSFSGSHRFVLDYLLAEVLQQQPAPIQQFLLRTSILDRLCGPLCDAVLGGPVGAGQATLQTIERANLFLVPLDDERRWYRYHHLFGELLRQYLPQEAGMDVSDIAVLHKRASIWYEAQGLDLEALRHAAAADDFARVAALAERSWERMDSSFQSVAWCRWVRQLPEEILRARPVLSTQYAWALMDAGEVEASEARLRDAERWLARSKVTGGEPEPATGEMAIIDARQFQALPTRIAFARAYNAQARGDVAAAVRHAALALTLTADAEPLLRAQAEVLMGMAHWASGELEKAHRAIASWVEYTRQAGKLAFALASAFYLAEIRIAQGQLREAARLCRQYLQLVPAEDEAMRLAAPHLHLGLALVAHEQGDVTAAALHLQTSKELGARVSLIDWPFRRCLAEAHIQEAAGNWEAALDLLDEAGRLYVRNPVPTMRPLAAIRARVHLRQGNLSAALAWAAERGLSVADELSYLHEFEHITLARLLLDRYRQERADGHLHAAQGLLARLLVAAAAAGRPASVIEILLLQSLAHEEQGDLQRALVPLERALALAEPEGYIRLFVDEGLSLARLLESLRDTGSGLKEYLHTLGIAFGANLATPPPPFNSEPLVEPLSEREREVLLLIAEGLSNQELAKRLYLSPHTIKVHTRNIYGKLGVTSRTQAVARGRALGLFDLP